MKKYMLMIAVVVCGLLCTVGSELQASEQETIVCPGKGERCCRVEVLGVPVWWKKKEKGGPGIIMVDKVN